MPNLNSRAKPWIRWVAEPINSTAAEPGGNANREFMYFCPFSIIIADLTDSRPFFLLSQLTEHCTQGQINQPHQKCCHKTLPGDSTHIYLIVMTRVASPNGKLSAKRHEPTVKVAHSYVHLTKDLPHLIHINQSLVLGILLLRCRYSSQRSCWRDFLMYTTSYFITGKPFKVLQVESPTSWRRKRP